MGQETLGAIVTLSAILAKAEGVRAEGKTEGKKDGAVFLLDPQTEATLYAGIGGEVLTVGKVVRLELHETYIAAETQKGERFFLDADTVKGLKLEKAPEARRDRFAGFNK